MNYDRKILRKVSLLDGCITIFANLFANVIQAVIPTPLTNSKDMSVWAEFMRSNSIINCVAPLSYVLPTLVCVLYSVLNLRQEKRAAKAILNIPLLFPLTSVIGWGLNFLTEFFVLLYVRSLYGIQISGILIQSFIYIIFSIVTVFTSAYLLIDLANRTYALPKLFPDGHIPDVAGRSRPRFAILLALCYVIMTVLPVCYLLSGAIVIQQNNGIPVHRGIIIMGSIFLVISMLITITLYRLAIHPLKTLGAGASAIKNGDYRFHVPIVSNDEIGILADSFNDMSAALAEKELMRQTFGKIVGPSVRDYLMKENLALGGETRNVTVLFCDIRSFTSMSEQMEPSQVVSLLNEYFSALEECISRNHGIINKYIGDAIMAIFGAPIAGENHARDAFRAVQDMRESLVLLNEKFAQSGRPAVSFGIGVHTGMVLAGNIGAQERMEYTVIGDTVNTASRMESLCKTYKTDLLLSEETVRQILAGTDASAQDTFAFVDEASIRGKKEKIKLYTSKPAASKAL
ncbi:MAG TPA: hypothetical protein DDW78_09330 [Treponema sp.]|nr:hypothetical protein [Treponema sp.]